MMPTKYPTISRRQFLKSATGFIGLSLAAKMADKIQALAKSPEEESNAYHEAIYNLAPEGEPLIGDLRLISSEVPYLELYTGEKWRVLRFDE